VFHLAAQAGVRYGEINPKAYIDSNITGFWTIIDLARKYSVENMVYASSSSVYGDRKTNSPSWLSDSSDNPKSLYAVTKKSNELIAKSYSDTFNFWSVWLRLFTVYWPLGRPDMAYFDFTKKCVSWQEITVFNNWNMERDFTYIDDVVKWIVLAAEYSTFGKSCIFNLGNWSPVKIKKIISIIESFFWFNINKNYSSAPKSDVDKTWADISISISELWWGLQFP
jgi:UDP-glucuronate 4-epimerase